MRRRMLNPDFFTDPDVIANLDAYGRLFYQGLWCVADDSGCFDKNTLYLKMKIFPGDDISGTSLENYIQILEKEGKIIPYEVNGKYYGYIKNFHKHQKLDKPSPPTIPLPEWIEWHGEEVYGNQRHKWHYEVKDISETSRGQVGDKSRPEMKGSGSGSEGEGNRNEKRPKSEPSSDDYQNNSRGQKNSGDNKFTSDSNAFKAALYLRSKILENNDRARVPKDDPEGKQIQKWAGEMDRLNRIGAPGAENQGYTWQEIKDIIDWCQSHHFWKTNILSATKLREQVDKLFVQMKEGGYKRDPPSVYNSQNFSPEQEEKKNKVESMVTDIKERTRSDSI